jgi:peptide/nickel transport system permease protein
MLPFIVRRLLVALPLLFVASFLVYVMVSVSGEPAPVENARFNPRMSEAQREAIAREFNLDKSVIERYWIWLSGVFTGDGLGTDNEGRDVAPQVWNALKITLRLILVVIVLAVLIALVIGVISALRQYTAFDYVTTFTAFVFFSLPVFWAAVLFKEILALELNELLGTTVFYTVGHESVRLPESFAGRMWDYFGHTALPALTLIVISVAQYSRFTRASMLDVLNADYVRTARAKGVPNRRVIIHHALRNALIPVTTIIAIDFGALFAGVVITERVFQWRAMGTLFIEGLDQYDVNMVMGWLMVTAIVVVVFNLIADVLYAYLDPRIRL